MSGALIGVELMFALMLPLGVLAVSPVAGVGAIEEIRGEGGSTMVDAEPRGAATSTTSFCGAGVTSGDSGLDIADLCLCRWTWAGC